MKYYYDTEFIERGIGYPLTLISIGIVAEDGRELYMVNDAVLWEKLPEEEFGWLHANVKPAHQKDLAEFGTSVSQMADRIRGFLSGDAEPELWAYFAAYDHVLFTQIFGKMIDQPKALWHTMDLKQEMRRLGISKSELPAQTEGKHRAIDDAKWNRKAHRRILAIEGRFA